MLIQTDDWRVRHSTSTAKCYQRFAPFVYVNSVSQENDKTLYERRIIIISLHLTPFTMSS